MTHTVYIQNVDPKPASQDNPTWELPDKYPDRGYSLDCKPIPTEVNTSSLINHDCFSSSAVPPDILSHPTDSQRQQLPPETGQCPDIHRGVEHPQHRMGFERCRDGQQIHRVEIGDEADEYTGRVPLTFYGILGGVCL